MNLSGLFRSSGTLESRKISEFFATNASNVMIILEELISPQTSTNLYIDQGDSAEIERLSRIIIVKDVMKLPPLFYKGDILSLSLALKLSLQQHEPIVPIEYYDHFLSPLAKFDVLLSRLPRWNMKLLTALCKHLVSIGGYNLSDGKLITLFDDIILRPTVKPSHKMSGTMTIEDKNDRIQAVCGIINHICHIGPDKELLPIKHKRSGSPKPLKVSLDVATNDVDNTQPSVQDRSVKITSPKHPSDTDPNIDYICEKLCMYGNITDLGKSGRNAVICFEKLESTRDCVRDILNIIPESYKVIHILLNIHVIFVYFNIFFVIYYIS